jgi:enediyne polyketide synthase
MSQQLLKKIEAFRKQKNLPILTLCKMMDVHNVTYHRWKNAGKITGAYKKIVEAFLAKSDKSAVNVPSISSSQKNTSDIAIVGIACYYPGASNVRELWENILGRRVQFRRMLDCRLPLSDYYNEDPKFPDKTYLTKAAFLENFHFDWGRLRIPRKTVESTDIVHWLALDIALKTFEDAGYKLSEIPLQNTGVILGNTLTGEQTRSQSLRLRWPFVQKALNATLGHLGKSPEERGQIASEMEKIYKSAFYPVTEDSLAGGLANTIAGRICNYLNLKGGGYIVDGACSSSLLAVATAADALKMGNMDLALAGGVDISLDPFELVGFAKAGALAKDQMRVYDQKANGFLPGEGCGFVLLKRLNDAVRDKNYIYAVIKGWGISSDGHGGIMEPSSSGQSFAIGRAYKDLEYKISDVDFVEGHGTGTTKGDRVELEGIAIAIDKTVKKGNENKRACGVTSFKSIVGHTKAAAGIGGLIKAVVAVNQRILPPTANCTNPNDVFQDKAKNLYPIIQGEQLPQARKSRAGISSAGFGGINCHITIESKDVPKKELKPKIDERALFVSHQESEVFVFTSRTIIHLEKVIQKFKEDLRNISIAEMADLAALLNKKVKERLPIKAAIVTDSPEHLYEALTLLENEISSFQIEEGIIHRIKAKDATTHIILSNGVKKTRIGFLYPGQGSQRLNMTRPLVERYSWARDLFKLSKLPLFESIYLATDKFLTKEEQQDFEKKLSDTRITQPAVVLSSLIWTEFLSKLGIEPQGCVGHSLGELTAFYKAGAFTEETLIKFAQLRGELMASNGHTTGSMVSLFCSKDKAEALIKKVSGNIVIANINNLNQTVVSGGKKEIEKIKELAQKENIPAFQLNVSNAFHSSFMKEASDKIKTTKIFPDKYKNNGIKVYSCVSGAAISDQVNLKEYFSKQAISPVNFVRAIESASKECDLMIEVGPGRVLTDLVKAINKEMVCLPVESFAGNARDLNIVLAEIFVRNVPVQWEELYKNRLIKTFVPASRKKFIENQCERPLKIGDQVLKHRFSPVLLQVKEEADQSEEIIPGGLPEIKGKDNIADLLVNLTHEITGFDRESISLNSRLLDDLNLDSIKAAELIGKAARTLGIPGQVDPSQLSNNTLGQIRDRLNELVVAAKTGPAKESVSDILKRYQDKTWVRNFVIDLRPEEIKTKNVNQLKGLKNIVFLSGKNEESLVKKCSVSLRARSSVSLRARRAKQSLKFQKIYFGESNGKTEKSSHIDCLITILPKNVLSHCHSRFSNCHSRESGNPLHSPKEFNKESLKLIMEHLHQVTDLANSNRLGKDSFVVFVQFGGGATSIASTLFLERPDLKVRVIDFDDKVDEDNISQKIIDELQTYESFSSVGYDSKLTRRVVYYENSHPEDYKKRDISWSSKDVVLVTGGAKGITAQCALEFARTTNAQMVLIGRSSMPDTHNRHSRESGNPEIIQTLKQFEKEDLKAVYYQCDVSNEKDVVSTIGKIEKKFGKITGFIHGAGLNSLKRLKQAAVQETFQEVLPKVMGAVNVCNALKNHPPKLIVGITSIIGLTGMEGSGWYGFSNEVLNLYLQNKFSVIPDYKSHVIPAKAGIQKPEVVTIAYSIWDEVGMGAKLGSVNRLAEKGIGAIPVKEGIKHFKQLVEGDPGCQQVIVAARVAGIATWKTAELKANNFRFLEKIEYILPGVELIAQAQLNIKDDPYLLDHNWKGSLLFPFVFGLEAMAQAVAYVLGIEKFDHIKAKDINLQRPIAVPQESGTAIEIHAQVLEQEMNKCHSRQINCHSRESGNLSHENRQVKVEIYSQETAYHEPHFSAIFEVDPKSVFARSAFQRSEATKQSLLKKVSKVIDLNMPTDIYGPILFQGKSFQCIEQIHELFYDEKTKKGECLLTSAYSKSTEELLKNSKKFNKRFLIGDPFFIDSMLQSMQLIIPQDLSLPRTIEEINLHSIDLKSKEPYHLKSYIHKISNEQGIGNTIAYDGDHKIFEIKNCDLKILQTIIERPSANDLVDPALRDQKIIEEKLSELSKEFAFEAPVIRCLYDNQLEGAKKDLRHKIETPLIMEAVTELLKRDKKAGGDFKIGWQKNGKPVVKGRNVKDIGVSVSHDGPFLIVVVGYKEQGCDVETLKERKNEEWLNVLGMDNYKIYKIAGKSGVNKDFVGTSIWGLMETIIKIEPGIHHKFLINKVTDNFIVFNLDNDRSKIVVTFSLKLTKGNSKVLTFFLIKTKNEINIDSSSSLLKEMGYNEDAFKLKLEYSGPQGQPVYAQRFPVTFKNTQNLGKSVYFSNYFNWIGDLREYTLYPIKAELIHLLESGQWGMATNHVKLQILGTLKTDDIVEVRFWLKQISGDKNSVLDLIFDWFKILQNNELERVAFSEQRVSWIQITGHGKGRVEAFPEPINKFIYSMRPRTNFENKQQDLSYPLNFKLGKNLSNYSINKPFLMEQFFNTSLEESNLVGNIYFANYGKWLGKTRDWYIFKILPKFYIGDQINKEFFCTNCEIYHLAEAMPFDKVKVKMFLGKIFENGIEFYFEFFKDNRRLAYASHQIIFGTGGGREFISEKLPPELLKNLLNMG